MLKNILKDLISEKFTVITFEKSDASLRWVNTTLDLCINKLCQLLGNKERECLSPGVQHRTLDPGSKGCGFKSCSGARFSHNIHIPQHRVEKY